MTQTFQLAVRTSRIAGKGLFAREAIPPRRKLGELTGQTISLREARRRVKKLHCIAIVEFDDGTAIDASRGGNHFRYLNHSCAPNTYLRLIRGRVEIYSLRPISRGDELTCDYGETQHEGTLRCRCGAAKCRGSI